MKNTQSCSQSPWCDEDCCRCKKWEEAEFEESRIKLLTIQAVKFGVESLSEHGKKKLLSLYELNGEWDGKVVGTEKNFIWNIFTGFAIIGFVIVMLLAVFVAPYL